jgi:hypothetical protein
VPVPAEKNHLGSDQEGFEALGLFWRAEDGQIEIEPGTTWLKKVGQKLDDKIRSVVEESKRADLGEIHDAIAQFLLPRIDYLDTVGADIEPLMRVAHQRYDWWTGMLDDWEWE